MARRYRSDEQRRDPLKTVRQGQDSHNPTNIPTYSPLRDDTDQYSPENMRTCTHSSLSLSSREMNDGLGRYWLGTSDLGASLSRPYSSVYLMMGSSCYSSQKWGSLIQGRRSYTSSSLATVSPLGTKRLGTKRLSSTSASSSEE